MLYRNTITDKMYYVASVLFSILDDSYYLAGGTGLSLQIGHRESVDLDYFSKNEINTKELLELINSKFKNSNIIVTYEERSTLWLNIDGVKVSFITRKEELIKDLVCVDVFRMSSIDDILLMKLSAICSRSEYKDYYDLVCISKIIDARSWVTIWSSAYPNSDPISFVIALNAVDSVDYLEIKASSMIPQNEIISNTKDIVAEINKFLF